MKRTKIVATLGPATDEPGILRGIIEAGADVIRFNMSHGDHAQHAGRMEQVRAARIELGLPVATLLDTKGPEIRTGKFAQPVELADGQRFTLTTRDLPGTSDICAISYAGLPGDVQPGQRILISDGLIEMTVDSVAYTDIVCTVVNGGKLSSNKGINCPGMHFSMPFLSDKDRSDLRFGMEQDFDYIAASFVRTAEDIREMRAELRRIGWEGVRIIAKIENAEGIEHMAEIIDEADGVMVARGDMGVEIAFEEIPSIQKALIAQTIAQGKQVVTATQMLESMMTNPRPTRAETTDVANAIYDGTSAIMLSGETAAGKYPVEAVRTMARIAERTESDINYKGRFEKHRGCSCGNITTAISHATVLTAHDLDSKAILTVTESGWTARMVSSYKPACPIIAGTPHRRVWRQMCLMWGVVPVLVEEKMSADELFSAALESAARCGILDGGGTVVLTAGVPLGQTGNTNLLKVQEI